MLYIFKKYAFYAHEICFIYMLYILRISFIFSIWFSQYSMVLICVEGQKYLATADKFKMEQNSKFFI